MPSWVSTASLLPCLSPSSNQQNHFMTVKLLQYDTHAPAALPGTWQLDFSYYPTRSHVCCHGWCIWLLGHHICSYSTTYSRDHFVLIHSSCSGWRTKAMIGRACMMFLWWPLTSTSTRQLEYFIPDNAKLRSFNNSVNRQLGADGSYQIKFTNYKLLKITRRKKT